MKTKTKMKMKINNSVGALSVLAIVFALSGCDITDEERAKLNDAQVDLEKIADQIIITYPANNATITDPVVTVRADIPEAAEAQEVTLFVDGIEVAKDTDGAPWEISWPSYYWANGESHTLLLKTITGGGNEVRNNQQSQVIVGKEANKGLKFAEGTDGLKLKDLNSLLVEYDTFPGATEYQISYSGSGQSGEVVSASDSIELSDLNVGEYVLRYRAVNVTSELTALIGPWSEPATIEVLSPDLPSISQPVITNSTTGYGIEISWENLGEGNTYTAYFSDVSASNTTAHELMDSTSLVLSDVSAGNYNFQLKRTNPFGHDSILSEPVEINVGVFHKRFGESGDDRGRYVLTTSSGQYLVLASTTSRGDSQGDDWIFKLNEQGEMVWEYLYNMPGSAKLSELVELSNGNIVGFGSTGNWPNRVGLVVLLDGEGEKIWEKEYANANFDQVAVKGVAELEGAVYIVSQGSECTTEGSSTTCKSQPPLVEAISLENGNINSSVQLASLEGVLWDGVSSFSTTSTGDFLLSFSVEKADCDNLYSLGCWGAGIATVDALGKIHSEWNSVGVPSFLNGRYAAESPLGGFVLSGQMEMNDGVPLALFDSGGIYTGTYTFSGAYSNQKEYIAFNDSGLMFQLVQKSSSDWPILISIDGNGSSQERITFSDLKRDSAYPAALDSTNDGGLVLLFTEYQSGNNNPDVVVVKIGGLE